MPNEIYHRSNWGNANAEEFGDVYYDHAATNKLYNHSDYYENSNGTDETLRDLSNKASIVLTPTAYSDGSLNTVIPPYQVLPTELVTNGTFDTDSDWSLHSGVTISGGTMNFTSTPGSYGSQDIGAKNGVKYKITFEITSETSGSLTIFLGAGNNVGVISGLGKKEIIATAITNLDSRLYFGNVFTGSIDNVSVKEIQEADFDFSRGSSATRVNEQGLIEDVQILSGELVQNGDFEQIGSELIVNGSFDTDSNWELSSGISYNSNGYIDFDGTQGFGRAKNTPNTTFVQGKIYKVVYEIKNYVSGTVKFRFQGGTNTIGQQQSGNGVKTQYKVCKDSSNDNFQFFGSPTFIGSIDNVSVKEVGQNWEFGTGWSMGDGKVIADGTMTSSDTLNQSYNFTDGNKYRFKFTVSDYQSGSVYIREPFNGNADAVSANGTFTFDYIAGSANEIRFRSDDGFIGSLDNVSFKEVTDDTDLPRIDFTDGTGSLLLEPQRTNLFTYSEDFSQSYWNKSALTVTLTSEIAPNGSSGSVYNIAGTLANLYAGGTTGVEHTISFYIKSNSAGKDKFKLRLGNNTSDEFTATNEWVRYSFTSTPATAVFGITTSASPNNELDLLVWGAQSEQADYATSYIPTNGSSVTRSADVANNSGNADLFNDSEGVLYAEIAALENDTTFRQMSINGGTTNTVRILYGTTSNQIRGFVQVASSTVADLSFISNDITTNSKIAVKYKENDFALWVNGFEVDTDTTGVSFGAGTLNSFDFNDNGSGGSPFYGNVKAVAVFKEALTDAELEKLTSWVSFTQMATDLEYTLE